jgi:hypothetical protein
LFDKLQIIEQRLLSPIGAGGIECREIEDAQRGLLALQAERTAFVSDFSVSQSLRF